MPPTQHRDNDEGLIEERRTDPPSQLERERGSVDRYEDRRNDNTKMHGFVPTAVEPEQR